MKQREDSICSKLSLEKFFVSLAKRLKVWYWKKKLRKNFTSIFYSLGSISWGSNTLKSLPFKEFNRGHSIFWPPKLIFLFLETFIPLIEWILFNSHKFKVPMLQLYCRCSKRLIRVIICNAKNYYLFNL